MGPTVCSEGPRARHKESRSGLSWPLTSRTQVWPGSEGFEGRMEAGDQWVDRIGGQDLQ